MLLFILVTLSTVWVQVSLLFFNGFINKAGSMIFYDVAIFRDSTVHLSLIGEMLNRFPPTNFGADGVALKNYHYIFDALLALLIKVISLPVLDVYFRIVPVCLSVLLAFLVYKVTYTFTKSRIFSSLAVFFVVFSTSLGALVPIFKSDVTGGNNMFMTDQVLNMMVNPQGILSIIVFLSLFLLINSWEKTKGIKYLIIFAILAGLSFGIKAYGGIVFGSALFITALCRRDKKFFLFCALGGLIMVGWILINLDGKVAGLKFAPFWLLDRMVSDIDRLNSPGLVAIKINPIRTVIISAYQLAIYIVGSMGIRILGFTGLLWIIKTKVKDSTATVFIVVVALVSFVIPLLTNQASKSYEVIQFTPYFTVFMGIMMTTALWLLSKKYKKIAAVLIFCFVAFTLFLDKRDFEYRSVAKKDVIEIPANYLLAIDFVKKNTDKDSIFLTPPPTLLDDYRLGNDYLWFGALAQRRTVFSNRRFVEQVGVDTDSLRTQISRVVENQQSSLRFDYVFYLSNNGDFGKIRSRKDLVTIYDTDGVIILKNEGTQ